MVISQKHPFHLVDPSPWPFITSSSVMLLVTGFVMFIHGFSNGSLVFLSGFLFVLISIIVWWRDVIREGTFEGQHTSTVQFGFRVGILLFILSEVMFFFAFFWAFFWASLSPVPEIGSVWPPIGIEVFNTFEIPFLNTVILLLSGFSVTWAHHSIVSGNFKEGFFSLIITICLAILFTLLQVFEYTSSTFSISDGIYGSVFFMATGFHGFHVFVGSCFLIVCFVRFYSFHFTKQHHFGFEAAAWYWHFVDVVWLFLFVSIYWWGNSILLNFFHINDIFSFGTI
ncbi:cytochrome B562 [PVC group bacterium (ex Bugula neritina AB1)]|nr:cytochrome B562 [PVC group bacterium (ex Bugula neritina AB1)]